MCIFFAFTICSSIKFALDTMAHQHPDPISVEKGTKPYSGKSQIHPWISHLSSLNSQFSSLTFSHKLSFPKSQDASPSGNLKQAGRGSCKFLTPILGRQKQVSIHSKPALSTEKFQDSQ
jgi:hypothetical protein